MIEFTYRLPTTIPHPRTCFKQMIWIYFHLATFLTWLSFLQLVLRIKKLITTVIASPLFKILVLQDQQHTNKNSQGSDCITSKKCERNHLANSWWKTEAWKSRRQKTGWNKDSFGYIEHKYFEALQKLSFSNNFSRERSVCQSKGEKHPWRCFPSTYSPSENFTTMSDDLLCCH